MKKSRKRGFAPLAVIIIIVALAAAVGVLVYQENVGINPVQEITPVSTNTISQTQEGSISSFAIVPSTKEGQSWTMYKKGAKAILKAKNITSAELWYTPTGTEKKEKKKKKKCGGGIKKMGGGKRGVFPPIHTPFFFYCPRKLFFYFFSLLGY